MLIWNSNEICTRDSTQITRCLGWLYHTIIELEQVPGGMNRKMKKAFKRATAKKKMKMITREAHKLSKLTSLTKKNLTTIINKFLGDMSVR